MIFKVGIALLTVTTVAVVAFLYIDSLHKIGFNVLALALLGPIAAGVAVMGYRIIRLYPG